MVVPSACYYLVRGPSHFSVRPSGQNQIVYLPYSIRCLQCCLVAGKITSHDDAAVPPEALTYGLCVYDEYYSETC